VMCNLPLLKSIVKQTISQVQNAVSIAKIYVISLAPSEEVKKRFDIRSLYRALPSIECTR